MNEPGDVIELLTRDHRMFRGLLEQVDRECDLAALTVLCERIGYELAAHEAAEEQVVFPAFRAAVPAGDSDALHRMGEHEEINELLAEMRVLTPGDPGFEKRASALCFELEAHFTAEEEDVFPRLKACLSRQELVELAERVLTVKKTAPPFPEPEFPDHVHAVRAPKPASRG